MARLIDLIQGRKLPVRVSYGGGWFEVIRHERGACFGFWDNGGPDGYLETDDEWELCPDQPEPAADNSYQSDCYPKPNIPMEEVRLGFRKVKKYATVYNTDTALRDTTIEAINDPDAIGYVEVDVWVKE